MSVEKILYTATATSTGGRSGTSKSSDGALSVSLTTPKELGGDGAAGTNPEQLFAAGYSACFIGAMKAVAGKMNVTLPASLSITAEVGIGPIPTGFNIAAKLTITAPGLERVVTETVVAAAHQVCPYSNATRGNVDVTLHIA
jgi:lipoyl-dependent peroxiredoxin